MGARRHELRRRGVRRRAARPRTSASSRCSSCSSARPTRPRQSSIDHRGRRAAAPRRRRVRGLGAGVDGAVAVMVAARVHRTVAVADHAAAGHRLRAGRRRALRTGRAGRVADTALRHLPGAVRDLSLGALMVGARLVPRGAACRSRARPVRSRHGAELRRADLEARRRRQPRRRGRAVRRPRAHPALEGDLGRARGRAARSRTPSAAPEPPRAAWSCTTTVCVPRLGARGPYARGRDGRRDQARGVQHRPRRRPVPAPTARSARVRAPARRSRGS